MLGARARQARGLLVLAATPSLPASTAQGGVRGGLPHIFAVVSTPWPGAALAKTQPFLSRSARTFSCPLCRKMVIVCRPCEGNRRFCPDCSGPARTARRAVVAAAYQRSPRGAENHRRRNRLCRKRKCARGGARGKKRDAPLCPPGPVLACLSGDSAELVHGGPTLPGPAGADRVPTSEVHEIQSTVQSIAADKVAPPGADRLWHAPLPAMLPLGAEGAFLLPASALAQGDKDRGCPPELRCSFCRLPVQPQLRRRHLSRPDPGRRRHASPRLPCGP